MARRNPIWVTPAGTAGYLSADEAEGVAGTRFGGHSRYKAKHPTRGPVPRFIERQARLEMPPGPLAAGWSTQSEVIEHPAGRTVKYHLLYRGEPTGKYALDPSKAALLTHRLELRDGKWRKRRPGWMTKKNPAREFGDPRLEFVPTVGTDGESLRRGPEGTLRKPYYVAAHSGSSWGWVKWRGENKKVVVYPPGWLSADDFGWKVAEDLRQQRMVVDWEDGEQHGKRGGKSAKKNPYGYTQDDYRAYYAEKKALGWDRKKISVNWKRKVQRAKKKTLGARKVERDARMAVQKEETRLRNEKKRLEARKHKGVMTFAFDEIYDLAQEIFGHSEFIHSSGMFDWNNETRVIQAELYSPKWSNWFEPALLKKFVSGLKKIRAKYKPYGLKMTVAVKNPGRW